MKLTCYQYKLPFSRPLKTTTTTFAYRRGCIFCYSHDEFPSGNNLILGEASPLPGFSTETLQQVQKQFQQNYKSILKAFLSSNPVQHLRQLFSSTALSPSLRFALDSMGYQIEAKRKNISLHERIYKQSYRHLPLNALISLDNVTHEELDTIIADGFTTIKAKIGTNFPAEFKRLCEIRKRYPQLKLRLDANGAWSQREAIRYLAKLQKLNIEYCEEPLQQVSPESLEKITEHTNVPIALDESLQQDNWKTLLPFASVMVLKPMVLGDFTSFHVTKQLAETHEIKAVVTTSLESAVGRTITAILAAEKSESATKIAHGLHTGRFLEADLVDDSVFIDKGHYHVEKYPLWHYIETQQLESIATNAVSYS